MKIKAIVMKTKFIKLFMLFNLLFSFHIAVCQINKQEYQENSTKDTINGVYIPLDLHDCFLQLDKVLMIEQRNQINNLPDKDATRELHNTIGKWIRDNWELWRGSRLLTWFKSKKVAHPDRISAFILKYYYDWLHNDNQYWEEWVSSNSEKLRL